MPGFPRGTQEDNGQTSMKILQININHCEVAHDLLMQTVRELKLDLVHISDPYKHLTGQSWDADTTTKAVIRSCGKLPFQSWHPFLQAPPSLSIVEFADFLDRLAEDANHHHPVAIDGDFNSWAVDWGNKQTNARGKALLEAFTALDVVLLNSGDTTTYTKDNASSTIDLTFISSNLARSSYNWRVMDIYNAGAIKNVEHIFFECPGFNH